MLRLHVHCPCWRRHSSVSVVTRLWSGRPGKREFDWRQGQIFFLCTTTSTPTLQSIQPSMQWAPGILWVSGYQQKHVGYHSPLYSEFQSVWNSSTSTPIRFHDVVLKRTEIFTCSDGLDTPEGQNVSRIVVFAHFDSMALKLLGHKRKINLLKMKCSLLYIRNQSVPRSKHFPSRLKKPIS